MSLEDRMELSKLRLEKADEALSDAQMMLGIGRCNLAANRAYYSVFYAMRAVLALDGIDRKHHSAIISEFRRLYIKTGIFESELSDTIRDLFDLRTDSDYDDYFIAVKSDVAEQIKNAEYFVERVKEYLSTQY